MGGAYAARATDVYGLIWNPAALARVEGWEVAGQHLNYLESINYEFAGLTIPVHKGTTLATGVQYLGSSDIQGTDNSGNLTGNFSSHYAAYSFALGQALNDLFSLGITGKWISAELSDTHASAYAADIGALYQASDRLALAATVTNIGSPLTFIDQSDSLPMAADVGISYSPAHHWNLSLDGVYQKTGMASAHAGVEWRPITVIALRAGYRTDTLRDLSALAGVSTGLAIHVLGQELSYAWIPMGELGEYAVSVAPASNSVKTRTRDAIWCTSAISRRRI